MSNFKAGSIFYTVEIDRQTLDKAKAAIRAFSTEVTRAGKSSGGSVQELKRLDSEAIALSKTISTLTDDFKDGRMESEEYGTAMEEAYRDAGNLRASLEALSGTVGDSAADQARYARSLAKVASIQEKAGQTASSSGGEYRRLGNEFQALVDSISGLGAEIRALDQDFDVTKGSIQEFDSKAEGLREALGGLRVQLDAVGNVSELSAAEVKKLAFAQGQLQRHTTRLEKATTRVTGRMNSMAIASQLSYGATTLLNDRIFQMSPALGILTNQLNFTTQGMRAWLTAIAPIVAVAGTLIGVIGGLVVSLKAGTGLESALTDVRKTTNLTDQELYNLTESFQEISKEIPIATSELLSMAQVAGQLGITGVDNIERFSETVARLAIATDVVGEQGATSLARFLQATGTAMDDMGTEAERVANVLNVLENTTAATAAEILKMTSYTQGLASQSGMTTEEILALNSAILSLGVKAEAGGSAVVRTMNKIQKAVSEGGSDLEAFAQYSGLTAEAFADLVRSSPLDALLSLATGMNEATASGSNLNDVLNELGINEVRERNTLSALTQGYDTLANSIDNARREAFLMNSLNEEVRLQTDTLRNKLILLGNRFVSVGQDIGRSLVPAAKDLVDSLIAITDAVDALTSAFIGLAAAITTRGLIALIPRLVTMFGNARAAISLFAGALAGGKGLIVALRGVAAAAGLALGPVGWATLLAVAVGVGATGLTYAFTKWRDRIDETQEKLDEFRGSAESAQDLFSRIRDEDDLRYALDGISESLDGPGKESWDRFKAKIIENIDKIEDLNEVINLAMDEFERLTLAPFEVDVALSRSNFIQEFNDQLRYLEIFAQENALAAMDVEAVIQGLRTIDFSPENITEAGLAITAMRNQISEQIPGSPISSELIEVNRVLMEILYGLEPVVSAQLALNDATAENASLQEEVNQAINNRPKPSDTTDGTGEPNAIERIVSSYEADKKRLDLLYYDLGEISFESYQEGMLEAASTARGGLIDIYAEGGELADEALSMLDEYKEKIDLASEAVEEIVRQRIALERLQFARAYSEEEMYPSTEVPKNFWENLKAIEHEAMMERLARIEFAREQFEEEMYPSTEVPDGFWESLKERENAAMMERLARIEFAREHFEEEMYPSTEVPDDFWENLKEKENAAIMERLERIRRARISVEEEMYPSTAAGEEFRQGIIDANEELENSLALIGSGIERGIIDPSERARLEIRAQEDYVRNLASAYGSDFHPAVIQAENDLRAMIDAYEESNRVMERQAVVLEQIRKDREEFEDQEDYYPSTAGADEFRNSVTAAYEEFSDSIREAQGLLRSELIPASEATERRIEAQRKLVSTLASIYGSELHPAVMAAKAALNALTESFDSSASANQYLLRSAYETIESAVNLEQALRLLEEAGFDLTPAMREMAETMFPQTDVERFSSALSEVAEQLTGINKTAFGAFSQLFSSAKKVSDGLKMMASDSDAAKASIVQGVAGIASAFASLLPVQESVANQAVEGFFAMGGAIAELVFQIPGLGEAVSAVGQVISRVLGDMGNGIRQIANQINEIVSGRGPVSLLSRSLIESFANASTEVVSRGGFLGLLGFKKKQIDEELFNYMISIADGLASGLASAMNQGIKAAIAGDPEWRKNLRKSIEESITDAIINVMIQSAIVNGIFQDFLNDITTAIAEGNIEKAFKIIDEQLDDLVDKAVNVGERVAKEIDEAFDEDSQGGVVRRDPPPSVNPPTARDHAKELADQYGDMFSQGFLTRLIKNFTIRGWHAVFYNMELALEALDIASTVANGFASGIKTGIEDAISGSQSWKQDLRQSMTDTLMGVIIDSFIQTAILEGLFADFMLNFSTMMAKGQIQSAIDYMAENLPGIIDDAGSLIEDFVNMLPPELKNGLEGDAGGGTDGGAAGTNISEITGPTRDLLIDLLRPLSILPSWTSMIQDIRNDVRAIAINSGVIGTGNLSLGTASIASASSIQGNTVYSFNNVTITTSASNVRDLTREISRFTYKEGRTGK